MKKKHRRPRHYGKKRQKAKKNRIEIAVIIAIVGTVIGEPLVGIIPALLYLAVTK